MERGGSKALRLVVQIVLARILAPSEFGSLAIMLVFITLGDILVLGGLGSALMQSPNDTESEYATAFWLSMLFALVAFAVLLIIAPLISLIYNDATLGPPLRALAFQFFPLAFNSIQVAKTTKALNMKPVFIGSILAEVLASILAVAMAYLGYGIWSLVAQQLASAFLTCLITATMVRWYPRICFNRYDALSLLQFGWKVMGTDLLNNITGSLYTLVIGKCYTAEQLGFYSQGQRYPLACSDVLIGALTPILLVDYSKRIQSNTAKAAAILGGTTSLVLLALCPLTFAACLFANQIIALLLTEKWLPCAFVFQIFCLVSLIRAISLIHRQAILAIGDSANPMRVSLVSLPVSIGLLGMVYACGGDINWAAVTWLLSIAFQQVLYSKLCKSKLNYKLVQQIKDLISPMMPSLVSTGIAVVLLLFGLPSPVAVAGYLLTCFLLSWEYMKHNRRKMFS